VARYYPTEPPSDEGHRFIENETGCQQGNLIASQEQCRSTMIRIFFVNQGIPGAGINENALHLES
jgi:hypothetical protein